MRGAMAGIALATFADRPSANKPLRERKTLSCKTSGRPLLGAPGFVQQAARNYSKISVFRSRIAIHYYNNQNYMYLLKYFLHEHLPFANICQAAGHQEPQPTRLKDGFALPFQMI